MELLEACADGDLSAVSALLQGGAAADAVSWRLRSRTAYLGGGGGCACVAAPWYSKVPSGWRSDGSVPNDEAPFRSVRRGDVEQEGAAHRLSMKEPPSDSSGDGFVRYAGLRPNDECSWSGGMSS